MLRDDYLLRQVKQLADALARIAGLRLDGNLDAAIEDAERAWDEVIGRPRGLVDIVDTQTLVAMLREPARIRAAAQLLVEEGRAREARQDARAAVCFRTALELRHAARAAEHSADDDAAILELERCLR